MARIFLSWSLLWDSLYTDRPLPYGSKVAAERSFAYRMSAVETHALERELFPQKTGSRRPDHCRLALPISVHTSAFRVSPTLSTFEYNLIITPDVPSGLGDGHGIEKSDAQRGDEEEWEIIAARTGPQT